ncbi:DUF5776 domain-containing protein [Lentilactobacillus otakiensis]|uniref:DUF5776 domain-containing protein n=1 Tax=Lentilactobacillus otakiensis TaxID=481720 RepID=UPI003D17E470
MNSKYKMLLKQVSISVAVFAGLAVSAPFVIPANALSNQATTQTNDQNIAAVPQSGTYTSSDTNSDYHFDWSLASDGTLTLSNASFVFGEGNTPGSTYIENAPRLKDVADAVTNIKIDGTPKASGSLQRLFQNFDNVETIDAHSINVSDVTSLQGLFNSDKNLKSVNLDGWNTNNVTNMSGLFQGTSINDIEGVDGLDTSNVTDMSSMFYSTVPSDDVKLTKTVQDFINVANVQKVKNFHAIFENNFITSLDISNWNMKAATDTSEMFGTSNVDNQSPLLLFSSSTMSTLTLGPDNRFTPGVSYTLFGVPTYIRFSAKAPIVPVTLPSGTNINLLVDKSGKWQAVGTGTIANPQGATWTNTDFDTKYAPTATRPAKETYVWKHTAPKLNINLKSPVTLKQGAKFDATSYFVSLTDGGNNAITAPITDIKDAEALGMTITGADKVNTKVPGTYNVVFKLGTQSATLKVTIPSPSSNGGGGSTNTNTNTNGNTTPSTNPNWNPTTPNKADGTTGLPNYAAVKGTAVYSTKAIYMYSDPTFSKSDRIAKYTKRTRTNRPMFVVTGYARSKSGALRYKVRDVNKHSKYYGKTGYITAKKNYVLNVYYQTMPKNKTITVIDKKGVNSYKTVSLKGKSTHYKKGTRLHVKKLVKHDLTTRYQLTNGHYVSANKKLVIQGNY